MPGDAPAKLLAKVRLPHVTASFARQNRLDPTAETNLLIYHCSLVISWVRHDGRREWVVSLAILDLEL